MARSTSAEGILTQRRRGRRDLDHAIQRMSKHPGVRMEPFEIRPADEDMNAMIAERSSA